MKDDRSLWSASPSAHRQWELFEEIVRKEQADFFVGNAPLVGARAPGRLDVMGGVADYSGSVVLEMPIAEAAFVAWQWRDDRKICVRSLGLEVEGLDSNVELSLDELVDSEGNVRPIPELRSYLTSNPRTRWSAYIVGCFCIMLAAYNKVAQRMTETRIGEFGANILVKSDVPLGGGVSSSAAIEVATMHALSEAAGIHPSDLTLAAWCQRVENTIVGAPCGIMDQVTSALGKEEALIILRCQPHDLLGSQRVPDGWRLLGIDSRVKHSVGGSHYTKARVGAFMGLKVVQLESGGKLLENYLCKMSPTEFATYRDEIPETITGREYTKLYGLLPDTITRVDPDETYHPRSCAEHPILENYRVRQFIGLMQVAEMRRDERFGDMRLDQVGLSEEDRDLIQQAGLLMYESHESYTTRLDLGSPETDLIVELIRERGVDFGLYGAKITGGGSGGTVAVLCEAGSSRSEEAVTEVCREYERRTGIMPGTFVGSSPGAVSFGARQILRG